MDATHQDNREREGAITAGDSRSHTDKAVPTSSSDGRDIEAGEPSAGAPAPEAAPSSKSKTWLWVALAVALVAVCGVCLLVRQSSQQGTVFVKPQPHIHRKKTIESGLGLPELYKPSNKKRLISSKLNRPEIENQNDQNGNHLHPTLDDAPLGLQLLFPEPDQIQHESSAHGHDDSEQGTPGVDQTQSVASNGNNSTGQNAINDGQQNHSSPQNTPAEIERGKQEKHQKQPNIGNVKSNDINPNDSCNSASGLPLKSEEYSAYLANLALNDPMNPDFDLSHNGTPGDMQQQSNSILSSLAVLERVKSLNSGAKDIELDKELIIEEVPFDMETKVKFLEEILSWIKAFKSAYPTIDAGYIVAAKEIYITRNVFNLNVNISTRLSPGQIYKYIIDITMFFPNMWSSVNDALINVKTNFQLKYLYYRYSCFNGFTESDAADAQRIRVANDYVDTKNDFLLNMQTSDDKTKFKKLIDHFYNEQTTIREDKSRLLVHVFNGDLHNSLACFFAYAAFVDGDELVVTNESLHKAFPMWFVANDTFLTKATAVGLQYIANTALLKAIDSASGNLTSKLNGHFGVQLAMQLLLLYNMVHQGGTFSVDALKARPHFDKIKNVKTFSELTYHLNTFECPVYPGTEVELLPDAPDFSA